MSKLGVKKLIVFALVAVSAIACFVAMGVLPDKINSWRSSQEQELDKDVYLDIGLDYEDGWHLIKTAEDYYTMTEVTSNGTANGAKFKLSNDITIDPRKANTHSFINATLDGNGCSIINELDPTYEPDVNSVNSQMTYNETNHLTGDGGLPCGNKYINAVSISNNNYEGNVGSLEDVSGQAIEIGEKSMNLAKDMSGRLLAIGGLFGYAISSNISNVYIKYTGQVSITIPNNYFNNAHLALGGLVGFANDCIFSNCLVRSYVGQEFFENSRQGVNGDYESGDDYNVDALVAIARDSTLESCAFVDMTDSTTTKWTSYTNTSGYSENSSSANRVINCYKLGTNIREYGLHTGFYDQSYGGDADSDGDGVADFGISGDLTQYEWTYHDGGLIQTYFVTEKMPVRKYTLIADSNGGTPTQNQELKVAEGTALSDVPDLKEPVRSTYKFTGWYTEAEGGRLVSTMPSANTTVYAHWSIQYTITAVTDKFGVSTTITNLPSGWNWISEDTQARKTVAEGQRVGTLPTINTNIFGYNFKGWTYFGSGGTFITDDTTVSSSMVYSDTTITIYPVFEIKNHTITLNTMGGTIDKDAYENVMLGYNRETDIITYNIGTDAGILTNMPLPNSTQITRGNCIFKHWKVALDSGLFYEGDTYGGDSGNVLNCEDLPGDVTLLAVWEPCTITYKLNGGTYNNSTDDQKQTYEWQTFLSLLGRPTYDGKTFSCWKVISGDGTWKFGTTYWAEQDVEAETMYGDVVLEAQWSEIPYYLHLYLNDTNLVGNAEIPDIVDRNGNDGLSLIEEETYTLLQFTVNNSFDLPIPTLNGYTFNGWEIYDDTDSTVLSKINFEYDDSGEYVVGVSAGSIQGGVYLYASWSIDEYTIYFDLNGGTWDPQTIYNPNANLSVDNDRLEYTIEESFVLPNGNHVKKDHYILDCWEIWEYNPSTQEYDLYTGTYRLGEELLNECKNMTLKAVWVPVEYQIELVLDGENEIFDATLTGYNPKNETTSKNARLEGNIIYYTIEDGFDLPSSEITKPGYEFLGWVVEVDDTDTTVNFDPDEGDYVTSLVAESHGKAKLQARWELNVYIIEFQLDNEGEATSTSIGYTIKDTITLPTPTREGYTFNNWLLTVASEGHNWGTVNTTTYSSGTIAAGKKGNVTLTAQWAPITYTIAYNGNGHTSGSMDSSTHTYDEESNLSANTYVRERHTFMGWAETSTGDVKYVDGQSVKNLANTQGSVVELFAKWEADVYTITADANNGTINQSKLNGWTLVANSSTQATKDVDSQTTLGTLPNVEREGYDFVEWNTSADGRGEAITVNTKPTSDMTIYAIWEISKYTIILDPDGGRVEEKTIEYTIEETISLPTPTREGYTFTNWKLTGASGEHNWGTVNSTTYNAGKLEAGKKGNVTLTAQWTPITYTIVYNGNGRTSGSVGNSTHTYDVSESLTINAYEKTGYHFTGWAETSTGDVKYVDGQSVINLANTQGAIVELFAKWEVDVYTITADANNGTINQSKLNGWTLVANSSTQATKDVDSQTTLGTLPEVVREGYDFVEWNTSADGSGEAITVNTKPTKIMTIYARWKPSVYTITADANGGTITALNGWTVVSGSTSKATKSVDSQTTIMPLPTIEREGYKDPVWKDGSGNEITNETKPSGDMTITAHWTPITYRIVYNGNGHTSGSVGNSTHRYDESKTLTINAYEKTGHHFTGWAETSTGDVKYVDGQSVKNLANTQGAVVELFAKWEANEYTITLELDGPPEKGEYGNGVLNYKPTGGATLTGLNITYTIKQKFNLPTWDNEISKQGYKFNGWKFIEVTDETQEHNWGTVNETIYSSGAEIEDKIGNIKLQAQWEANEYEITLVLDGVGEVGEAELVNYNPTGKISGTKGSPVVTYTVEDGFDLPSEAAGKIKKPNYTFQGWILSVGQTDVNVNFEQDANEYLIKVLQGSIGSVSIQAVWETITYEIELVLDNGQEYKAELDYDRAKQKSGKTVIEYTAEDSFDLPKGTDADEKKEISRTGYKFLGWEVIEKGSVNFTPTTGYVTKVVKESSGYAKIQAVWEAREYTIELDFNDTEANQSEASIDKYLSPTEYPKYANKVITYTVESKFNLPNGEITRSGYIFLGWEVIEEETAKTIKFNPENGEYVTSVEGLSYGNGKLKAHWDTAEYTIKLEYNQDEELPSYPGVIEGYTLPSGVSGKLKYDATNREITYTTEDEFDFPSTHVKRIGYTFTGWTVKSEDGSINFDETEDKKYVIGILVQSQGNATIEANWELNPYEITLVLDGVGEVGEAELVNYNPTGKIIGTKGSPVVTYTVEDGFPLPKWDQEVKEIIKPNNGYIFLGWKVVTEETANTVNFDPDIGNYVTTLVVGSYGNAKLQAVWELVPFQLTLDPNGGAFDSYNPTGVTPEEQADGTIKIEYDIESNFNIPTRNEVKITGYTAMEWEIITTHIDGGWENEGTTLQQGFNVTDRYGHVTLKAIWTENRYNIVLHANNTTNNATEVLRVGYTNLVQITKVEAGSRTVEISGTQTRSIVVDWDLSYARHNFVGWSSAGYDAVQTYEYIATNFVTTNIEGDIGLSIIQDGVSVSQLKVGDYESNPTINIYAIWLPIYTLEIVANGAEVYDNGIATKNESILVDNHYYQEYDLYTQIDYEIFNTPGTGKRLHYYGHYITNWIIMVGEKYYTVKEGMSYNYDPLYTDWLETSDSSKRVLSGTNMQYLQGDITAIPQWKPLTFDVRYVTNSTEKYKEGYEETKISQVTYDNEYIVSITDNITKPETTDVILATDILGYSPIYAHPYNDTELDTGKEISISGTWSYTLAYRQYTTGDVYEKDSGWYIVVEGYYAPDLYRLKLDLQLPTTIDFKVNNNGYELVSTSLTDLQTRYSAMVPGIVDDKAVYTESEKYTERQHRIYQVESEYYIYLLQDQIVEDEKVYNLYYNGKTIANPILSGGVQLPNFEIAYYQMQYYYTLNNESEVNMYQIGDMDEDHKEVAQAKLSVGASKVSENTDWKYAYCDTNEDLNTGFALKVYWYRNVVNLGIKNLLDDKDSFNGYTLIEEVEQVTGELQGHSKYHLVIYTNDAVIGYVTYAFDDISLLQATKYEYTKLVELFNTKSVEELARLGLSKGTTNELPIYFGNIFKVHAVDQSKDHTLDEFVGYRFDHYTQTATNKQGEASTCTSITEFGNNAYTVEVDLKNYEYVDASTTNYVLDKDTIALGVHFTKIQYVFRYQVTDSGYNLVSKYGDILFNYQEDEIELSQFEYVVTVNSENTLRARMQVRLGTELISWLLVNEQVTLDLTERNSQTCRFVVDAEFLRNSIYLEEYSSEAEQKVGDVNAVCQDIEFKIRVNVLDLSTEQVIREYVLSELESEMFGIRTIGGASVTEVSIDNRYVIKMLSKKSGEEFLYYEQEGQQYAVRSLYIKYSLAHSTNMLVNEFGYPIEAIGDISMEVNHSLLDGTINYIEDTEVSEENRYLNFYVDVAPTYEIRFKVTNNENDQYKQDRQVSIESVVVASGVEGEGLKIERGRYLGYWGQQEVFNFNATNTYYKEAKLKVDYVDEGLADTEFKVGVNSNTRQAINKEAEVTIELIPQTYTIKVYAEYGETRYSTNEEYGENGELPINELVNASGKQIFAPDGITIKADVNNILPTQGIYYNKDKVNIKYELNSEISSDFTVAVYSNNIRVYENTEVGAYVVEFIDKDIEVVIQVRAITDEVVITTNMPSHNVGTIYVQVNESEAVKVDDNLALTLINGDKLNIYIKEEVAYEFTETYEYRLNPTEVEVYEGTGEYVGYKKITLFNEGFELSKKGWYYLVFEQIPIEVEFKYYTTIPEVEEVEAGEGYIASSTTAIIQKGSVIRLTRGNDEVGYRFAGYKYVTPSGIDSKELVTTKINETQEEFEIGEEILEYLSTKEKTEGKLLLEIYVTYVRQYTYEVEYLCKAEDIYTKVTSGEIGLQEGVYYDYGTELSMEIRTVDTEHYKIEVELENADGEEVINTSNVDGVEEVTRNNIGNVSGVKIRRQLTSNYVISIDMEAEGYDTVLKQVLTKEVDGEGDEESTRLQGQGSGVFNLYENIYYEVEGTHKYGSEVKVKVYVQKATEDGKQYYMISGAKLNGKELMLTYEGEGEIEGQTSYVYTFSYKLKGEDLPTEMELDISFNALYFVKVG